MERLKPQNGIVDFAPGRSGISGIHGRKMFSARVGNVRITVPSVRRSSKYRLWPRVGRFLLYLTGFSLLLWGLYSGAAVLAYCNGSLEITNCLLAIFSGSFVIFLANHDQAVSRRVTANRQSR